MAGLKDIKGQQIDEETDLLDELVRAKLDVSFQETALLARTTALKSDESTGVIVGAYNGFVAALALDTGTSREEFLKEMGEAYDEAIDAAAKEEVEDDEDEPGMNLPPVT